MADHAANVPECTLAPPLRCYERVLGRPDGVCGELATWKRDGGKFWLDGFFCAAHRQPSDVPIAGVRVFRRVRLSVDVLFAAIDPNQTLAQAEALHRLERIVAAAGGLLDVDSVRSSFVKWTPPAGHGAISGRGDGAE